MPITLYMFDRSPNCRATMLTIKALGLDVKFKYVDLTKGEQKSESFKKLNPCGKVPVLDDNGFVMWESRAINAYLVDKYGTPSNSSLYPSDRHKRAIVDIMLHFDNGTLSNCIVEYFNPIAFFGQPPEPRRGVAVDENLGILDRILTTRKFVAGNEVTIADFSIISAITTLQAANYNFDAFPHLNQWIQDFMQAVPFYDDVTGKGVKQMYAMAKEKLAQLNKK